MNDYQFNKVLTYLIGLQNDICKSFEAIEHKHQFEQDAWQHTNGGGGRTRVLRGNIFESAGVNFSQVLGDKLPSSATAKRPELAGSGFSPFQSGFGVGVRSRLRITPSTISSI